jgi:hypothetical protein
MADYANMRSAAKAAKTGGKIPDGIYLSRLTSAKYERTENGRECISLVWTILQKGPYQGKTLKQRFFEDVVFSWNNFCSSLELLGTDLTTIGSRADVEDALENLVMEGPRMPIEAKTQKNNPQYSNYFIVAPKATGTTEKPKAAPAVEPEPEDPEEFAEDVPEEDFDFPEPETPQTATPPKAAPRQAARPAPTRRAPVAAADPFGED